MYISGIHLGKAYSVPVNVCKLTNFTFDILRQCGEYIIRGRKEVEKEGK
jgi:hypothetical protein